MNPLLKAIAQTIASNVSRLPTRNNAIQGTDAFAVNNAVLVGQPDNTNTYIKQGYNVNSTVYSIVSQLARKFGSIPVAGYKKIDDSAAVDYKAMSDLAFQTGDFRLLSKALKIKKKALQVLPEKSKVTKLLRRPNPLQGGSAFWENLMGFKLLTGAGVCWANRPTNKEPYELWVLPTQDIVIIVDNLQYLIPSGYQLQVNYISDLDAADVLYWKYWNPNWDTMGNHLYGQAPLKAAMLDVKDDNAGKVASITLKENQGAKGVIYRDGPETISPDQRDSIKNKINENVNGKYNRGRVEVANVPLGYINLGMTAEDMGVIQSRGLTKEDLCNVFQFPVPLLSSKEMTLSNYETALRALVTQCTMPEWCGLRDDLNAWLTPMFGDSSLWIEPDFSLLPELQKNMKDLSMAVKNIWQLTPNQALDYLGFETNPTDEAMNRVYIPSGYSLLDDVANGAADMGATTDALSAAGMNDYNNG